MAQFLENLLTASFHGSIVILVVILLRLILKKTPRKYICLLWLLAGVRLLMPIEVRSDLSMQPQIPSMFASVFQVSWFGILPWIWGVIACCFGIYSLISYVKLKRTVRDAVRIRGGWESDRIDTAFILGFIKPQIYIPMGMSSQSRKHILAHERTHLEKGDHWIKMIGFLALALHWFNPLVWVAYILLCRDIEMACDECVVRFMELEERRDYSAALLSCSSQQMHFAASPVAFGEVSVKQRILSVLNYKKPSFWISLLGVLAFLFVAVCLVTSPTAPAEEYVAETLSPEEQAQQALMQKCYEDVEAALSQSEIRYEIIATNETGTVLWVTDLLRQENDTLWLYTPSTSPEATNGRMEYQGMHYAYRSGSWMETDTIDPGFAEWLDLFRWDASTCEFVKEEEHTNGVGIVFTTRWEGADKTTYTAAVTCSYDAQGNLKAVLVEQPNYDYADKVYLHFVPTATLSETPSTVSERFAEEAAKIVQEVVTAEELAIQAEYEDWGVSFRVDDDRLSSAGADVFLSQLDNGRGSISTTDQYWLERNVDGEWVTVPTVTNPKWTEEQTGVSKGKATFFYLDWTPIYGKLEPGDYRMGKIFHCSDDNASYGRSHTFYSEFSVRETVDASSSEAAAAVERCYAALEELKAREHIHFKSMFAWEEETWVNCDNYLTISTFGEDESTPENKGRVDIYARWENASYSQVRENPDVRSSQVIGMELSTLDPNYTASLAEDYSISFFERSNSEISFPEGIGVIRDDMVCFVKTWEVVGMVESEASAQLTYRFDAEGNLTYMEYKTLWRDTESVYWIEVYDTSPEEIDAIIKPYTENLIVDTFSWEEVKAKYTDGEFDIREEGFVNTEESSITGPVDAARLALKEYPNLADYLSIDVFHDEDAGMWKVTIESYVDYQATYGYRDVYMDENGVTQLLVYEGPVSWNETRK